MSETKHVLIGNRYRLEQPIGYGRAGNVWLAFDTIWHRTVATKKLYLDPAQGPEPAKTAALDGGRKARLIIDDNAVKVYDALCDGDDVWLVMEYVPARSMADFLADYGRLTPAHTAYLGIALGSALAAAHSVGVLHRAVEPRKVLLAEDGGVKLTDIGIDGAAPDPAFQAPEVLGGQSHTIASDAYSLGAILFAAVEGAPPFGPDGTGEPAVPRDAGTLTGTLLKLLRGDPNLRPTITDTMDALKAINQGRPEGYIPPTAPAMQAVLTTPESPPPQDLQQKPLKLPSPPQRYGIGLLVILVVVSMVVFAVVM